MRVLKHYPFHAGIIVFEVDAYFNQVDVRIDMLQIHLNIPKTVT